MASEESYTRSLNNISLINNNGSDDDHHNDYSLELVKYSDRKFPI